MTNKQKQVLTCSDCGEKFVFSVNEQEFYEEKGFPPPKRCKFCRKIRKENNNG